MMILKEFSRIVCVSLFSYQGSLFVCLSDSSFTLSHSSAPVKYFFKFFRGILMFVCHSQATCLLYHMFVSLSTIIFVFSKLFKLFIQKKQFLVTALLEYHYPTELSTLFETFFIFSISYTLRPAASQYSNCHIQSQNCNKYFCSDPRFFFICTSFNTIFKFLSFPDTLSA